MTENSSEQFHVSKKKTNVRRMGYLIIFLFANPSWTTLVIGSALVLLAVLLHGWAAGYIARAQRSDRETRLTVGGPYRHTRHPYYFAHLMMDAGFFVATGLPLFYLLYFPFMFGVYRWWVIREEASLKEIFGEAYEKFKSAVPRWGFRLVAADPDITNRTFSWRIFDKNNELKRTLSHLFLLGILWNFYLIANPFEFLSIQIQATIVGLSASWILLRDVEPGSRTTRNLSLIFVGSVSVLLAILLVPTWEFDLFFKMLTVKRLISLKLAILISVILTGVFLPQIRKTFLKFYKDSFPNNMLYCLFWFISVSLLISCVELLWSGILLTSAPRFLELGGMNISSLKMR